MCKEIAHAVGFRILYEFEKIFGRAGILFLECKKGFKHSGGGTGSRHHFYHLGILHTLFIKIREVILFIGGNGFYTVADGCRFRKIYVIETFPEVFNLLIDLFAFDIPVFKFL